MPLCVYFKDDGPKGKLFEDKFVKSSAVGDAYSKVVWFAIAFDRKSDEAKQLRVTRGPALVILDCSKADKPKTVKKLTGGNPLAIRAYIERTAKKLQK